MSDMAHYPIGEMIINVVFMSLVLVPHLAARGCYFENWVI
jgi:hypothetical protein